MAQEALGAAARQSAGGHEAEDARVPWLGTACPEPQQSHHPGSPEHHISLAAKTNLPPSSYSKCRARSQAVREASRILQQFYQTQHFLVEHFHFSESAALESVCLSVCRQQ